MFKLVIAEKPSVGIAIANVLGARKQKSGFYEGNGYIVAWCIGHLAGVANASAYNPDYAYWRYEHLPIIPDKWQNSLRKKTYQHFQLLKKTMHRKDVSEIINACDAGREGELIFRNAYNFAECNKPVKRLWISSMEDEAIRKGFENLKPSEMYDNLYYSADARAKADWLVGINLTRLFSVLYHRKLCIGRVVTPTLALIISREAERTEFVPETYYNAQITCGKLKATSERLSDKAEAEKIIAECSNQLATVISVNGEEKEEKAPLLYDLTTLQRDANRILGYTAQQTLDYAQSLYEKKLCTYPRTDSRYLTEDMEGTIDALLKVSSRLTSSNLKNHEFITYKVCNNKKVSDHHAIIPTLTAGKADLFELNKGERDILKMISLRLICSVSEPYVYYSETAVIRCGNTDFKVKYKDITEYGWKDFMKSDDEDEIIIENGIEIGDVYEVTETEVKEGKTKPKPHYTEDTLLSAMENAGAAEAPKDAERKGLGTPATRANMIEKLVSVGYIERKQGKKGAVLVPAKIGKSLITVVPEHIQSPLLTAEWEHRLKLIENGDLDADLFLSGIADMVTDICKNYVISPDADELFPSGREVIGTCPRCGGNVTESQLGFFCENAKCRFGLWRDNRYLDSKHILLDKEIASELLKNGRCRIPKVYSEKNDSYYAASLIMTDNGERTKYSVV